MARVTVDEKKLADYGKFSRRPSYTSLPPTDPKAKAAREANERARAEKDEPDEQDSA